MRSVSGVTTSLAPFPRYSYLHSDPEFRVESCHRHAADKSLQQEMRIECNKRQKAYI